jgi:hypothetical protein
MDDVLQNDDKAVKTLWCEQTVQACMIHSRYLMYVYIQSLPTVLELESQPLGAAWHRR